MSDDGLRDSDSGDEEQEQRRRPSRDVDEEEEEEEEEEGDGASSDYEGSDDGDGGGGDRKRASSSSGRGKKRARESAAASKKKSRRGDMSRFYDEMAEVDDDAEEDYDDNDRANANELTAMERDMHERIARRQEKSKAFMEQSLEEQAEQIMRRHGVRLPRDELGLGDDDDDDDDFSMRPGRDGGSGSGGAGVAGAGRRRGEGGGYSDDDGGDDGAGVVDPEVAQQALLPGISDKSLFVVECKTGKENSLCLSLMNKAVHFKANGKPFGLTSVVVPAGTKGFLYLEAQNEPAVKMAINGLRGIYHSKLRKVPIPDMTAVLSVRSATRAKPVRENQFVRLKRKPYNDDLAKVVEVLAGGERAVVQFIPRIDLVALSADRETALARKALRPPQRFFNPEEIKHASDENVVERRRFQGHGDHMDFFQNNFFLNGFVVKEVNVGTWLRTDRVNPTLEEIQRFKSRREQKDRMEDEDSEEERNREAEDKETEIMEDLAMAQAMEPSSEAPLFAKGDTVIVVKGDLTDLMGRVLRVAQAGGSTADAIVYMQPLVEELAGEVVELKPDQLEKFLKVGGHVRIIDGRYTGETGTILKVIKNPDGRSRAMVLTDMSSKELEVYVSQLQETSEVSTGLDSLQGYELYDLVMLGPNEVGVVTRVNREDLEVVNNSGNVKRVRPQEIRGKRNTQSRRAFVVDTQQNQLEVDNVVEVVEGQHAGSKGTIKHIDRTTLFLHSRTHTANGGIFPVRARSALLAGRMNRAQAAVGYMGEINASAKNDIVKDFRNRNDEMLAKSVKVIKGQHKGLMGQVVEATDTHVKVELHSKLKKVFIARNQVKIVGDQTGAYAGNQFQRPAMGEVPGTPYATQTPMHGQQTPMHGSQTPMHGSQTPMHGSQTPIHGSQTPIHGSQTPVHGSQTPIHGSQTPQHGAQTPLGAGGQTPLHGSQTPIHGAQTPIHGTGGETPGSSRGERSNWDASSRDGGGRGGYSPAPTADGGYTPSSDGYGRRGGYGGSRTPHSESYSPMSSSAGAGQNGSYTPSSIYSPAAWSSSEVSGSTSTRDLPPPPSGWTRNGVCVEVIATGRKGHVTEQGQDMEDLTVEVEGVGIRALRPEEVRPVAPQIRDAVMVIGSRNDGRTGILKKIDGKDGIVRYKGEAGRDVIPLQNILRLK